MLLINLFISLFICFLTFSAAHLPLDVPVDDLGVQYAASLAIASINRRDKVEASRVLKASRQMLGGMKFELTMEVLKTDGTCLVKEFGVYIREGPPPEITENFTLPEACTFLKKPS